MTSQLTLEFEPGLAERHKSLRECMVSCVYSRGLSNVADDLGKSPGNLSAELAEDSPRHFSIDSLERYLKKTGDMTPIHYLLAQYLGDQAAVEGAALARVQDQLTDMAAMVAQLAQAQGVKAAAKRR